MDINSANSLYKPDNNGWLVHPEWIEFLANDQVNAAVSLTADSSTSPVLTCSKWGQTFSTSANSARFPFLPSKKAVDPVTGTVTLGLEKQKNSESTFRLEDLIKNFADADVSETKIGKTILQKLGAAAGLKIDDADSRNALWYLPGPKLGISIALTFKIEPDEGKMNEISKALSEEFGFSIDAKSVAKSIKFYCQRTIWGTRVERPSANSGTEISHDIESTYRITLRINLGPLDLWLRLDPVKTQVSLTRNVSSKETIDFWTMIGKLTSSAPSKEVASPRAPWLSPTVEPLILYVEKDVKDNFVWDIEVIVGLKAGTNPSRQLLRLGYNSALSAFVGGLIGKESFQADQTVPFYSVGSPLPAPEILDSLPSISDIRNIFTELQSLPQHIPTLISSSKVSLLTVKSDNDTKTYLNLSGVLHSPSSSDPIGTVPAPFRWSELQFSLSLSDSLFSFSASSSFVLKPAVTTDNSSLPANLALRLAYKSTSWQVEGHVSNLSGGLLLGFFESDLQSSIPSLLGRLTINDLSMLYTYENSVASSFLLSGIVSLGKLELRLFFQHVSSNATPGNIAAKSESYRMPNDPSALEPPSGGGSAWSFSCRLGATEEKTTLGDIVDSIVPDAAARLPDFVKGIDIEPASDANSLLTLRLIKVGPGSVVLEFKLRIGPVELFVFQKSIGESTRRILRLSVDKLPVIKDIPLLDKLEQPFDEMVYMWVSGDGDLSQGDVASINTILDPSDYLLYKSTTKPDPGAIAIKSKHHFMIIDDGKVIVDHAFDIGADESTQGIANSNSPSTLVTAVAAPNNAPSKGTMSRKFGPLSINGLTLQYKNKVLVVTMNAILQLGPISLGLLGFGFGIDTGDKIIGSTTEKFKLTDFKSVLRRISVKLDGLSVSFEQPPLLMSGLFEHTSITTDSLTQDAYMGGVGISIPPYTIVGVGSYALVTKSDSSGSFKSIFIYAKLDGPIAQLGFASISGVRLGFGLNSMVKTPSIDMITSFPFINDRGSSGAGNDPMKILKAMQPEWVTPVENSYWLAAGMSVTAFSVLQVTAVAIFGFREEGVVISVVADAVAQLPATAKVTEKGAMLLRVEFGIIAELNYIDGYFRVEASLAPTSFLLVPQCRLTGGFALVNWFGNSPYAGDWVFSVGGYHRAFNAPAHYPRPERMGIAFNVGNNIQITGQSYFAITPKVAMAGALIHVSLKVGPVDAFLDASFDVLINFHPFHYMADFHIAIGVTFDADVAFIHVHISASVGADLHIEGPEFGGYAHVDFYLFAFDIKFGNTIAAKPPQSLLDFWDMAHKLGPESSPPSGKAAEENPLRTLVTYDNNKTKDFAEPAFKFVLNAGNVPKPPQPSANSNGVPPSTGAGTKWYVNGGSFRFSVLCDFPVNAGSVSGQQLPTESSTIYSKPMQISKSPMQSSLKITIKRQDNGQVVTSWTEISYLKAALPSALFGRYSVANDPMTPAGRRSSGLLDGKTGANLNLSNGISIAAPLAVLDKAMIPKFKATAASRLQVMNGRDDWILPRKESIQSKFVGKQLTPEEKAMTLLERWQATSKTWKDSSQGKDIILNGSKGLLAQAALDVFGWDKSRSQSELGVDLWKLQGKTPVKLIDRLVDNYLALPRIAVS